jgi:hypothetical protein
LKLPNRYARIVEGATLLEQALGRKNAVRALLLLHQQSPLGANDLTLGLRGYSQSGLIIAKHLASHGLAEVRQVPGVAGRVAYRIALTPLGGRIAQGLGAMARAMERVPG